MQTKGNVSVQKITDRVNRVAKIHGRVCPVVAIKGNITKEEIKGDVMK